MTTDALLARRHFLILRATRWFPAGLVAPVIVLYLIDRGLTLTQVGVAMAAQGVMVLALELPTGGFADAVGRRRVLLVANGFELASLVLFLVGGSVAWFVAAYALQGVFRALESGPLDAWYVDAVNAAGDAESIERGLGAGGVVLGLAVASGAAVSGLLVWVGGALSGVDALALPLLVAFALRLVDTALVWRLMDEHSRSERGATMRSSFAEVPAVIRSSFALLRASAALPLLVAVELTWGLGMSTFEVLFRAKMADVLDSPDRAAALMGPVVAAGWAASAGGAAAIPWLRERFGRIPLAATMRLAQAATIVAMGALAGPVGATAAFLANYAVHGASNPLHQTLLHREAQARNRATVVSLNSMAFGAAGTVGVIMLGAIADGAGIAAGMFTGAFFLALGAPLYIAAGRVRGPEAEPTAEPIS